MSRQDTGSGRPRLDKLGVRPGMLVSLAGIDGLGQDAAAWRDELTERGALVHERPQDDSDLIFVVIDHREQLRLIAALRSQLTRDGALWVLRPRGSSDISESEVRNAGLDAGLVDVKVARFSDTHTALKFVYRLRDR